MRHWRLVAACAVLGAVLAIGVSLLVPPSYTARTELFLASTGGNPEDRAQNGAYIQNRMATYAGIVTSPVVLNVVRTNLDIPASERLSDDVTATNPLDTALIQITVVGSSAQRVEAVADEIGRVADSAIGRLEAETGGSPARISVVRPAVAPEGPDSPSQRLYAAIGLVLGLVVGAGAALLRDARAQRRQSSNGQVDGVPVVSASSTRHTGAEAGPARGTGQP